MTYEEFLANVNKLDKEREYYYFSQKGKFKLKGVENNIVKTLVEKKDLSKKEHPVSKKIIEAYLIELKKGLPIDCAKVNSERGTLRSIPPSLLCLMPHIFALKINKRTHIVELEKKTHNLGELKFIDEKDIPERKKQMHSMGNEPFQKIFFGAPGTGKSHKIDYNLFKDKDGISIGVGLKEIPESNKFRTTFHPDYDYAQFVGAYKPQKSQVTNKTLNKNELTAILKEMKDGNNYPIHKFSALYSDSLLKLSNAEQIEIIKEAESPESMAVELKKGIAVGEYLKEKIDGGSITYSFVPQVFAKAYAAAWKQYFSAGNKSTTENQVYLVIEEINRGNCAQIFGDIFQLLDRNDKGFSDYSINIDSDFADWLKTDSKDGLQTVWNDYIGFSYEKDGKVIHPVSERSIALPPNLNILATMNTSDQSLFPMDSAFKRRFDWEYVPINYKMPKADFKVGEGDLIFDWHHFLKKVNADIRTVTESEDKQMGEFFIKPKNNGPITLEEFRSKVLFYLWDTVYKDETDKKNLFHFSYPEKGPDITFQRLFEEDEAGKLSDNSKKIIRKMLETLDAAYNSEEYNDFKLFPVPAKPTEDK